MTNTPLGELIARGRTADIHAWEDGYVLKLFHNWFELEDIEYEARLARAVQASGLPVPDVGAIVQVNGRNGLVYKRVDGIPMLEVLGRKPELVFRYARRLAVLHAQLHAQGFSPEIPPQRRRLENKIRQATALPARLQSLALAALDSLPDGDRICHGDFHPANVLLTSQGEVVIDWIDASRGNPLADVARTTIITLGAANSAQISNPVMKAFVRLFHAAYLRQYFKLCPGGEAEYQRWLPIVAAARLSEEIPEVERWLIAEAQKLEHGS